MRGRVENRTEKQRRGTEVLESLQLSEGGKLSVDLMYLLKGQRGIAAALKMNAQYANEWGSADGLHPIVPIRYVAFHTSILAQAQRHLCHPLYSSGSG